MDLAVLDLPLKKQFKQQLTGLERGAVSSKHKDCYGVAVSAFRGLLPLRLGLPLSWDFTQK